MASLTRATSNISYVILKDIMLATITKVLATVTLLLAITVIMLVFIALMLASSVTNAGY